MTQLNHLIEIVKDPKEKNRLRARSVQDGRWVRFPNNLRKEKALYEATKMTKGRGDSWIAGGTISPFVVKNEKNVQLEEALNIKNKLLLKQFYEVIFDANTGKVNTEMMNIIFLVKKIYPDIDEQILTPLIKKYPHSAFISSDLLIPLQNMLQVYNEKRIVSIFSNYGEQEDFIEDTVEMYERLFRNDIEISNVMPEKPKSIRELHTIFMRECEKIKVPKNSLNQNLSYLIDKKIGEYELVIPETTHDLISIGNPLNICVGNGSYGLKVLQKRCNIVAAKDKNGKYMYCIEFHKGQIIQARGSWNSDMPINLKKEFLELLQIEKKVA